MCGALKGKLLFQLHLLQHVCIQMTESFVFPESFSVFLWTKMPIASGAEGRVDVGIDTSLTWTPHGLKRRTKPANKKCDSYLQR